MSDQEKAGKDLASRQLDAAVGRRHPGTKRSGRIATLLM
jgi:hypothetical protein